MAFNLPAGKISRVTLGGGILRVNAWPGATPTAANDVGFCREATLALTRTKLELLQGVPKTFITVYSVQESAVLGIKGLQWDTARLADLLGTGNLTANQPPGGSRLGFGGDIAFDFVNVQLVHQFPLGQTLTVNFWKAVGGGELNQTLGDDFHEFQYQFTAVNAATDWSNQTLAADSQLCAIDLMGTFT